MLKKSAQVRQKIYRNQNTLIPLEMQQITRVIRTWAWWLSVNSETKSAKRLGGGGRCRIDNSRPSISSEVVFKFLYSSVITFFYKNNKQFLKKIQLSQALFSTFNFPKFESNFVRSTMSQRPFISNSHASRSQGHACGHRSCC